MSGPPYRDYLRQDDAEPTGPGWFSYLPRDRVDGVDDEVADDGEHDGDVGDPENGGGGQEGAGRSGER